MDELKTRAYSKEQLMSYLSKHGSTLEEAANIVGTSPRTLGRYLAMGVIPSAWLSAIFSELKDQKPKVKPKKAIFETCSACGKKMTMILGGDGKSHFYVDNYHLAKIGITNLPASGWHYPDADMIARGWPRKRLYPVCESCHKLIDAPEKRKKLIGKISNKK